jgi:hypothetical protein
MLWLLSVGPPAFLKKPEFPLSIRGSAYFYVCAPEKIIARSLGGRIRVYQERGWMNPKQINLEDVELLASFLRALAEGRTEQASLEEWEVWMKFLDIYPAITRRMDWFPRRMEFVDECQRWLQRQGEDVLQLTDDRLVKVTGSHYYFWLKFRPYPVPVCNEGMLPTKLNGQPKRIDEMEDPRQETPEQALIIQQETKPPRARGRPRKTTA